MSQFTLHWNSFPVFILSTFITLSCSSPSPPCPPLSALPGTVVSCTLPSTNETIDCLNINSTAEIPRGTIANYKCERDENFSENIVKCRCRGRWRGLQAFNDFMSKCNISDYSIDGPKELNLTEREIRQLALPVDADSSNFTGFQEDAAAYHNLYRKIHHSPPLKLNETLNEAAQRWADQEVSQANLKTEPWSDRWYSQNMYRIYGSGIDAREAVRLATAAWYQGAYTYNWEDISGQSAFTQVVWKSTTDLGIGVAKSGNSTVVVADYYPPGNIVVVNPSLPSADKWAWFRENVLPPNPINSASTPSSNGETLTTISSTTEYSTTQN